jgi:hypothetical protein
MRVSDEWVKDYAAGKHLVSRDLALDLQDARAALAEAVAERDACGWALLDERQKAALNSIGIKEPT